MIHRVGLCTVLGLVLLAGAGCRSTDPAFYDAEQRHVRDLEPKATIVAVLPVELGDVSKSFAGQGGAKAGPGGIPFALNPAQLRATIVDTLRDLRAAGGQVIEIDDAESDAAKSADVIIGPKFKSAKLGYVSKVRVPASTALWFCTWIGGFWVEDQRYSADVTLEWSIQRGKGQRKTQTTRATNIIDLPLWERTDPQSRGFYQSMIMPPYWTTPNLELTSRNLSERAVESATARLVAALKTGSPK